MSKFKFLSLLLLSSFLLIGCDSVSDETVDNILEPEIVLLESSGYLSSEAELFHDFGDLDIEAGLVSHSIVFENTGEEDLRVYSLQTSCMCTVAQLLFEDGSESDSYGMSASELSYNVSPGESFEVLIIYDPMAHGPEATGEVNRSVILTTSSEENGRLAVEDPATGYSFTQMNIKGMVLSSEDFSNLE